MNRDHKPGPKKLATQRENPSSRGSARPKTASTASVSPARAAGHVAAMMAREYWEELAKPQGKWLIDILRAHPEETGLLNDYQKFRLRSYLEGLARWHGWLRGHNQRLVEWPLLLASLLESDRIDDNHRNWANRCDIRPERLMALAGAPNWAVRGEGYRRIVGSQRANVDPWALFPGWFRNHLPSLPADESAKNWHSQILEGFQYRPHQWLRVRDLGKHKTIEDNIEKLSDATGQSPWRARKMPASIRFPKHIITPRPGDPWPWLNQDFSDQAVAAVCDPDPGERWCVFEPEKLSVVIDLADRMKGKGLVVVASTNEKLLKSAAIMARRSGCHNITTKPCGKDTIPGKAGSYDGVLIHSTGMGMNHWRTEPELRLRSDESRLQPTVELIQSRLKTGVTGLKKGGRLVYAVGSMTAEETEKMADWMVADNQGLVPQELIDPRNGELGSTRLFMWPDHNWGEAVFITKWLKSVPVTESPKS